MRRPARLAHPRQRSLRAPSLASLHRGALWDPAPRGALPAPEPLMATILAISNQKGGVGKTTTAINLAAALATAGQRVLLVDLDPQGNATSGLGVDPAGSGGAYALLLGDGDLPDHARDTSIDTLDVLPATPELVGAEIELVDRAGRERALRKALDGARALYDWILIDCPPSLGLLTVNALVAADRVLIPLQAEYYAMEGLSQLLRTITAVRKGPNPDLIREGIVITMYDQRNNLCREVARQAVELFGAEVFRTLIPRNVRLGEAPSYGCSIVEYAPRSSGSRSYIALAVELLERHGHSAALLKEAL
jgi:chromosome partitioning protein